MHPPLNIIDQTDELIAIEWLRENDFDTYAEHMEHYMDLLPFNPPLCVWENERCLFLHFLSVSISYFGSFRRRSQSYSLTYTRCFNSSRTRSFSCSKSGSREKSSILSAQSSRRQLAGSNSISRSRSMRHLYR